ncbi:MAG: Holliday junction branch migration protein RuvA [Patescibacteria group bacterium]
MISIINGKVVSKDGGLLTVVTAGGVGYEVTTNINSAKQWDVGSEAHILTHLAVRENAMELYGFSEHEEKNLFEKFLLVSGIGPKTAMHLLSLGSVQEISSAIARGDLNYLTNVSGIGKKTAERIVVELKSKVLDYNSGASEIGNSQLGDVVAGLEALGYSATEAREAVKKLDAAGKTSERLLKEALRAIK